MKLLQKALFFLPVLLATLASVPTASAQLTHLTITQVYGGGGGASTTTVPTYNQDYVEIFNPTTMPMALGGLSVQYSSTTFSTPMSGNNVALPSVTLQPGQFFLVGGQTSTSYTGAALSPSADVQGATLAISATNGVVFLVRSTTAITTCTASTIIDKVGFGTANCYEGTVSPALTSQSALLRRAGNGICADTDVNSADFGTPVMNPNNGTPPTFAPHDFMSTPFAPCSASAASLTATGYPSPVNKGTASNITITAKNSSGAVQTAYLGTVKLTSSDAAATLPAAYTFTAADAGIHVFSVSLNTPGTQSITATDSGYGLTASQTGINVTSNNPAASITAGGYPTPTNRGAAHSVTVSAKDSSGNIATSYVGTVTLTSTDPAAVLPAPYTFTAGDAGIHVFSVTFNTTGTQSITATDTTNNFASSQTGIVVNATLWIVNANTTVSHVTQGGLVLSTAGTAGTPATLGGIAVDNAGFAYAVTNAASNLTQYSPTTGALLYTSTAGGINQPNAVTVDGLGSVWIANANNTITQLNVSPSTAPIPVSPATGYTGGALATPSAIVVDSTGSVWVANSTGGTFTRFFGAAAPVTIPLVTSVTNGTLGTRP